MGLSVQVLGYWLNAVKRVMTSGNNSPYVLSLVVIDPAVWGRRGNGLKKRCAALANRMGAGGRVESILVRQYLPLSQRSGAGRQQLRDEVQKRTKALEYKCTYEEGSSSSEERTRQENAHNVYYGKLLAAAPAAAPAVVRQVLVRACSFSLRVRAKALTILARALAMRGRAEPGRALLSRRPHPIVEPDGRRK